MASNQLRNSVDVRASKNSRISGAGLGTPDQFEDNDFINQHLQQQEQKRNNNDNANDSMDELDNDLLDNKD